MSRATRAERWPRVDGLGKQEQVASQIIKRGPAGTVGGRLAIRHLMVLHQRGNVNPHGSANLNQQVSFKQSRTQKRKASGTLG